MTQDPKTPEIIEQEWQDGLKALSELHGLAHDKRLCWCRVGRGLLAGKLKCPANQNFGKWLNETDYRDVHQDDRQSAMWLSLNQEFILPLLTNTYLSNPTRIRRNIREKMPEVY